MSGSQARNQVGRNRPVGRRIQLAVRPGDDSYADQDRECGVRPPEAGGRLRGEQRTPSRVHGSISHSWYSSGSASTTHSSASRRICSRHAVHAHLDDVASVVPGTARDALAHLLAGAVARSRELGERPLREAIPEWQLVLPKRCLPAFGVDGGRLPRRARVVAGDAEQAEGRQWPQLEPRESEEDDDPRKAPTNQRRSDAETWSAGAWRAHVASRLAYASAPASVKNMMPPTIAPESLSALPRNAPT